jgi:hypothetical protein
LYYRSFPLLGTFRTNVPTPTGQNEVKIPSYDIDGWCARLGLEGNDDWLSALK